MWVFLEMLIVKLGGLVMVVIEFEDDCLVMMLDVEKVFVEIISIDDSF